MPRSTLKLSRDEWASLIDTLSNSGTDDFAQLVALSGLDPAKHLRFANWSGVSFAGSDLRSYDFTGARLMNCNFTDARIEGARFDQAVMNGSNLRSARDWNNYLRQWKPRRHGLPDDSHLRIGGVFQDAPFGPEMVVVPPGKFMMGSPDDEPGRFPDEGPRHMVTISAPFAMSRYAVTFEEWDFAQADKNWREITGQKPRRPRDEGWGRGRRPAIRISWKDAQAYVRWLSAKSGLAYRLPSEAEWEYCCRAGTDTPFSWGASITPAQANYNGKYVYAGGEKGEYREKTEPVDAFTANAFGLYQMHGNVCEWVEDIRRNSYVGAPDDGSAWTGRDKGLRVLRGGSWSSVPHVLRAAYRFRNAPVFRYNITGFRLSRTLNL